MGKMKFDAEEIIIRACVDCVLGNPLLEAKPLNVNLDSEKARSIVKSQLNFYRISGALTVFNEEEAVTAVIEAIKKL